jgi:3-methyladenine DNA glycosylase AlkD
MDIRKEILSKGNKEKAAFLQRYFKTGNGEYGEGDVFVGVAVPVLRMIAKRNFARLSLHDISKLLRSKIHEERFVALAMLCLRFDRFPEDRKRIIGLYLSSTKYINNWDLVDTSAPHILGKYLLYSEDKKEMRIINGLAKSSNVWERRIAVISTQCFIKRGRFDETLGLAERLLKDKHDLIHKAVGWMLREVGEKDLSVLEDFLKKHCKKMPRTMLRYAIERMPEEKRKKYMNREA